MTRPVAAATPALRALARAGVPHSVRSFDHDAVTAGELGFGVEAAAALGVDPARVFKTLVVDLDGELVVGIVSVGTRLDLKALAAALRGKRAALAEAHLAEKATGYVVGGISPLGARRRLRTALDSCAATFDTVWVSAGRRGLDVELAPSDLARLTGAVLAPLTR